MPYSVYILYSESSDRFYTGFTEDLERRWKEHQIGKTKSIRFATDWKIMWSKDVQTSSDARELEVRIKTRGAKRFLSDLEA